MSLGTQIVNYYLWTCDCCGRVLRTENDKLPEGWTIFSKIKHQCAECNK